MRKASYRIVFGGSLSHQAKYQGGFVKVNGRSNNSSAYNHDYYMRNKQKWKVKKNGGYTPKEEAMYKEIEEHGKRVGFTPENLFRTQDFGLTLMEFGGFDVDNMSKEELDRLESNYKKKFGIDSGLKPGLAGNRMGNGMPSDVRRIMNKREEDEEDEFWNRPNRKGNRMTGGMPTEAKRKMTEAYKREARRKVSNKSGNVFKRSGNA